VVFPVFSTVLAKILFAVAKTQPCVAGEWEPWGHAGQMTPAKITWGVKHGILTRQIFWKEIFLGTQPTGQLILSKIIQIVATSSQILRPKCTKFNFS